MKRFLSLVISFVLLAVAALSATPILAAEATNTNLIPNPSLELNSSGKPTSWITNKWGTNTSTFTYKNSGSKSGTYSASTKTTAYTSGDAKWYFAPVAVQPNTTYTFSDWYKSNAKSTVDVEITSTDNKISYIWLGDRASSANAWNQAVYTFKTPANAAKITVYHSLSSVGEITTDDFSLTTQATTPPTAPAVSMTAPTANATVNGTVTLSASASDAQAVSSVQFKVDGANVGTPDTTSPYSTSWNTASVANGQRTITAIATNAAGLTATSSSVTVNVQNAATPTTPSVSVTAPANGSTVSASTTVSATATDTTPVAGVQFKLDGANLGTEDTTFPYSVSWDTKTVANGSHSLTAVARNTAGGTATSTAVSVTVKNTVAPTAPTVAISAPTAGSTVNSSIALSANASDAQSVSSVQFKVDGTNVGTADTTAPYSISWDSKSAANGNHTVTAVATNASGLTTTSSPVTINVQNTATPPPVPSTNLIANESVESGTPAPTSWTGDGWGTNTRTLSYEATGRTGTHSLKATITSYQDGDAKWYFKEVPVTGGKTYDYSNWYKSNVTTELDAMVTMGDGSIQYFWLGSINPSTADWQKASTQFTAPVGAVNLTIFQVVYSVGYVQTDDYSLTEYVPQHFNRALVSITFDDGWRSIYTNGFPLLQKYGLPSTQYLNSEPIMGGWDDYMTYQMVKDYAAAGHELGWHTRTHADVTKLSASALNTELTIPGGFLTGIGMSAASFTNFASPYGAYNAASTNQIMQKYRSHRSTDVGYNTKDNFSITNIRVQNIVSTTTPAQVQTWVNQAIKDSSWLVLVYHEVDAGAADPTYAVTPANLDAELNIVKQSGVTVKTVEQALNEILAQL